MPTTTSKKARDADPKLRVKRRVAKWGNSLGLRIPREGVEQLRLAEGTEVDVIVNRNQMTITVTETKRPTRRRRRSENALARLLEGVTPDVGGEIFGPPVGKEIL